MVVSAHIHLPDIADSLLNMHIWRFFVDVAKSLPFPKKIHGLPHQFYNRINRLMRLHAENEHSLRHIRHNIKQSGAGLHGTNRHIKMISLNPFDCLTAATSQIRTVKHLLI